MRLPSTFTNFLLSSLLLQTDTNTYLRSNFKGCILHTALFRSPTYSLVLEFNFILHSSLKVPFPLLKSYVWCAFHHVYSEVFLVNNTFQQHSRSVVFSNILHIVSTEISFWRLHWILNYLPVSFGLPTEAIRVFISFLVSILCGLPVFFALKTLPLEVNVFWMASS